MDIDKKLHIIMNEIRFVLTKMNSDEIKKVCRAVLKCKRIVCVGAGRVGMTTQAFAMRLSHLGLNAYMLGDANVPKIGVGDLLLVASGSGETQTIYDLVVRAKDSGVTIALITGNTDSRMGKLADVIVQIKAPSKTKPLDNFTSIQPMTTLNEQCLWIFFDALVLELMEKTGENNESMTKRHSILE